jgi:hypothetical protein
VQFIRPLFPGFITWAARPRRGSSAARCCVTVFTSCDMRTVGSQLPSIRYSLTTGSHSHASVHALAAKKKIYARRSSSFRAPPPPWLALLVSPEFSSRVAGPPGAGLGRPLCVPVPVLATPCDDCVGRYKETVLAVTKIPYKKYNPLRYGLKPNEHVGD